MPAKFQEAAPGPTTTAPASQSGHDASAVLPGAEPVDSWWVRLSDPMLDSLVGRSLQSNIDLQTAEAAIREARAQRQVVAADLWPQLNAGGAYSYRGSSLNAGPHVKNPSLGETLRASTAGTISGIVSRAAGGVGTGTGTGTGTTFAGRLVSYGAQKLAGKIQENALKVTVPRESNLFQAGFDASWELDVFGGTRRAIEAAEAQIGAAQEQLHDLQTTLISEVAINYIDVRSNQKRLTIAQENIQAQRDTLELTRVKFKAGLTSDLDVAQAAAQLATTESQVPVFESLRQQAIHRLSVLLGQEPGALQGELEREQPIPLPPPTVPVGLPSELLRRRPDIRQSERQLAAATAQIGVATADLYPRFTITGSLGTQTSDMQHFLDRNSGFFSIGPGVSWPIFQGGRIRANIAVQNARQEQAFSQYRSIILTALQDVDNALVAFRQEQNRYGRLQNAVEANRRAVSLANERYRKGLANFLSVLESQRALYVTQDAMVESEATVIGNYIALHKALGGGWQTANGTDVSSPK
jgi:NodT family efflux transporter outer membrane factor (OMF) lipoprotein